MLGEQDVEPLDGDRWRRVVEVRERVSAPREGADVVPE
jgi:hypothetical protein